MPALAPAAAPASCFDGRAASWSLRATHAGASATAARGRTLYAIRYPCSVAIENARCGRIAAKRSASSAALRRESLGARDECAMPTYVADDSDADVDAEDDAADGVEEDGEDAALSRREAYPESFSSCSSSSSSSF